MIGKDKKVDVFYNNVCLYFSINKAWPDFSKIGIANGGCEGCGSLHDDGVVHEMATTFWKCDGDVDEEWKRVARVHGFDADDLQEIMLGVFIGADSAHVKRITDNFDVHNIGFAKP